MSISTLAEPFPQVHDNGLSCSIPAENSDRADLDSRFGPTAWYQAI